MRHNELISQSFSPSAEMYLASPVHAAGPDLPWLARVIARMHRPSVLDLGCGAGHASFAAAPFAREVVALDRTESMLHVTSAAARHRQLSNISTLLSSVQPLPFAAARFDCVVSRYSAHHWTDLPLALREVRRVLKPGGIACFIDVAGPPNPLLDTHLQAVELARDPSHVRDFTKLEWLALFNSLSFNVHVEQEWRLALDFSSWVNRIGATPQRIAAIRTLWSGAPAEVCSYFKLRDDLSFQVDAIMILAQLPADSC